MSGVELRESFDSDVSVGTFVGQNAAYYETIFERLQKAELPHGGIFISGVFYFIYGSSWRGVWLMFWLSLGA